jgi:hypothetical protein
MVALVFMMVGFLLLPLGDGHDEPGYRRGREADGLDPLGSLFEVVGVDGDEVLLPDDHAEREEDCGVATPNDRVPSIHGSHATAGSGIGGKSLRTL